MLGTKKINIFAFAFGKRGAAKKVKTSSKSISGTNNSPQFDALSGRINITKVEDFYKVHALNTINPLSRLNR